MALKIEQSTGLVEFEKQSTLLIAETKMGKSSAYSDPSAQALYLDVDHTLGFLKVNKIEINSWGDFANPDFGKDMRAEATTGKYKYFVFDTINRLYQMCEGTVCVKHNCLAPSEKRDKNDVNVYEIASVEFLRWITPYLSMGIGIVFLCHADRKPVTIKHGVVKDTVEKLVPALRPSVSRNLSASVHNQFYIGIESDDKGDSRRYLYTQHTQLFEAGSRLPTLPAQILLESGEKSYSNIKSAWDKAALEFANSRIPAGKDKPNVAK